jgi:hypothetical protein
MHGDLLTMPFHSAVSCNPKTRSYSLYKIVCVVYYVQSINILHYWALFMSRRAAVSQFVQLLDCPVLQSRIFTRTFRPVGWTTRAPIQWVSGFFAEFKAAGREVNHSPLSHAEAKNERSHNSVSSYMPSWRGYYKKLHIYKSRKSYGEVRYAFIWLPATRH